MQFDVLLMQIELIKIYFFQLPSNIYFVAAKIIAAARNCLIPFIDIKYIPPVIYTYKLNSNILVYLYKTSTISTFVINAVIKINI